MRVVALELDRLGAGQCLLMDDWLLVKGRSSINNRSILAVHLLFEDWCLGGCRGGLTPGSGGQLDDAVGGCVLLRPELGGQSVELRLGGLLHAEVLGTDAVKFA